MGVCPLCKLRPRVVLRMGLGRNLRLADAERAREWS